MLNHISNKTTIILYASALCVPIYFWVKYWKFKKNLKNQYKELKEFHLKHNRIVMYSRSRMAEYSKKGCRITQKTLTSMDQLFSPIIYFLNTAQKSLDIAVMMIHLKCLLDTICEVSKRGIQVRVILHYNSSDLQHLNTLKQAGVQVRYYVQPHVTIESIFHYKYVVKDYDPETGGYAYLGSLNWTHSGVCDNYEDTMYTTNTKIVAALQNNFEETWKFVENSVKMYSGIKAVLLAPK